MLRDLFSDSFCKRKILLASAIFIFCASFQTNSFAQSFSVSFPIGSTVYQNNETPLTIVIEGVSCDNTVIKCHQGLVSMIGRCKYIYRCNKIGWDTVKVFVRKGHKLQKLGEQIFEVKERPMPKGDLGGLTGGTIKKGFLLAQQGVGGHWFLGGNHWEACSIESFNFIVFKNDKVIVDIYNKGNFFTEETRVAIQNLEPGDKIIISNIKGCIANAGGNLRAMEFSID